MISSSDFDRVLLLFRRVRALPELPGIALRLTEAVDSGVASALDLEKIISSDPALAARILRIANTGRAGWTDNEVSTIRMAILKLGQRSVKNLAVSLIMDSMTHSIGDGGPDPNRIAHHSLATAFLARYLFARRQQKSEFESHWSADELFAATLLHDIALPLLYQVSPEVFQRINLTAVRGQTSYDWAFERIYKHPMNELGGAAMEAWGLPSIFQSVCWHWREPWGCVEEFPALCCVHYANHLATAFGLSSEPWTIEEDLALEVEEEVGLAPEEVALAIELIERQVDAYTNVKPGSEALKTA